MLLACLSGVAHANGLTTHVWITMEAHRHLPEGDLRTLVEDPENERYLRNGAMFPDGGYPIGDAYAEMAHWEPFQGQFLDWIVATWGRPPYEGEAAHHVAFLLGQASHGMGDQVFDANYIERVRVYDAASDYSTSFDEATDVALAAALGGQPIPELWIPEVFPELFLAAGHTVTMDTLEQGQTLTAIALAYVEAASGNPETVAGYEAAWPWATSHLFDENVTGTPADEAVAVAWYWQQIWDRLEGTFDFDPPVIGTFPADGGRAHPTDHTSIESRLTLVFARGLIPDSIPIGAITVADDTGKMYQPQIQVYYGYASHVVLLVPTEDWASESDFTVTVGPYPTTIAGDVAAEPWSFTFSTRPEAVTEDTGGQDTASGDSESSPCGCGSTSAPGAWVMGLTALLSWGRRGIRGRVPKS